MPTAPPPILCTAEEFKASVPGMTTEELFALLRNEYGLRHGRQPDGGYHYRPEFFQEAWERYQRGERFTQATFDALNPPSKIRNEGSLTPRVARVHQPTKAEQLLAYIAEQGGCITDRPNGGLYKDLATRLDSTPASIAKMVAMHRQQGALEPVARAGKQTICLRLTQQPEPEAVAV